MTLGESPVPDTPRRTASRDDEGQPLQFKNRSVATDSLSRFLFLGRAPVEVFQGIPVADVAASAVSESSPY